MSEDKAIDPKGTSSNDLIRTSEPGKVELSEKELDKAAGGAGVQISDIQISKQVDKSSSTL